MSRWVACWSTHALSKPFDFNWQFLIIVPETYL